MNNPIGRYGTRDEELRKLRAQLQSERSRAARLQATLVVEQQKVRQLQDAFNRSDSQVWNQNHTIDTLKLELRAIANTAANLQERILEIGSPPALALPAQEDTRAASMEPAVPLSPEAEAQNAELQAALHDLEGRLQDAVGLVLDELNTRKAAEARIRELEAQLAAFRTRIERGGWPDKFREE